MIIDTNKVVKYCKERSCGDCVFYGVVYPGCYYRGENNYCIFDGFDKKGFLEAYAKIEKEAEK